MLTEQNEEKYMYLTIIIIILMYMYTVNMPCTCFSCMWEMVVVHICTCIHNKTTHTCMCKRTFIHDSMLQTDGGC